MPRLITAMRDAFSLPDLRRRILFTLGILILFRFIAILPLPGVDLDRLAEVFQNVPLLVCSICSAAAH
jgi:preprotein translocase subunit SecY